MQYIGLGQALNFLFQNNTQIGLEQAWRDLPLRKKKSNAIYTALQIRKESITQKENSVDFYRGAIDSGLV